MSSISSLTRTLGFALDSKNGQSLKLSTSRDGGRTSHRFGCDDKNGGLCDGENHHWRVKGQDQGAIVDGANRCAPRGAHVALR